MTVQAQNSVQYYNGPIEIGTELSIVEFTFIDNSHVSAKVRGNTEVWQYGYDYTVSGAQTLVRTITVQRRVAENEVLAVYLDVPITQNISPEEGGNFPASTNEYVLDKLTHISQMLDERLKRSLQISIDTPFSGTLPAPEPNKALKISADGNSFVMSDYDPDTALVLTEQYRSEAQAAAEVAVASKDTSIEKANIAIEKAAVATTQANKVEDIYTEAVPALNKIIVDGQSDLSEAIVEGQQSLANASNALRQTQITNCLLEVPQNIKLELNDGVLTLKAGSKVIVPNGFKADGTTPKFDEVVVESDKSATVSTTPLRLVKYAVVYDSDRNRIWVNQEMSELTSGTVPTAETSSYFYNTTTNILTFYSGGVGEERLYSFPLGVVIYNPNQSVSSIDQVFNGIGYIGNTIFCDKGVKGLIPNGRNEDGTLNNKEFVTPRVFVDTSVVNSRAIYVNVVGFGDGNVVYNDAENLNYWGSNISASCIAGEVFVENKKITSFQPKQPFHAVDYNDFKEKTTYLEENSLNKSQITNCLLEVPQRIKYTLVDGTLIILKGSVAIFPYGTEDKTTEFPIGSNFLSSTALKVVDTSWDGERFFVWAELQANREVAKISSAGSTKPYFACLSKNGGIDRNPNHESGNGSSFASSWETYYNTTTNIVCAISGSQVIAQYHSLPLLACNADNTNLNWGSIDQVFNGIGYIGSTIWVDKGVKGLIPDGRNEDGILKNIEYISSKIITKSYPNSYSRNNADIVIDKTGVINFTNINYEVKDDGYIYNQAGTAKLSMFSFATYSSDGETITFFKPKQPFRAVDYNNKPEISGWPMPSNKYISLTLGASSTTYIAPANGWYCLRIRITEADTQGSLENQTTGIYSNTHTPRTNSFCYCYVPAKRGDVVLIYYTGTANSSIFRFVYAEGEK